MSPFSFALRGLMRQPGRTTLGIAGIAATGALLFDMLMLSRGLVVSMEQLLSGVGFDIRVSATQATPLTGPPLTDMAKTVAALAALPEIEEVVPLRLGDAQVDINKRSNDVTFIGADVTNRRPWTLVDGRDLTNDPTDDAPSTEDNRPSPVLVNRNLARRLNLQRGARLTLRGACTSNSSVPPVLFHVSGIIEFPFDRARELTAITSLRDFARTCGDAPDDQADMLMIASRSSRDPRDPRDLRRGDGASPAVEAIRRVRPDLTAVTNDELVARFQQVEFSYFRQISVVLATITMFFGLLLITVLLSVSTNQRLGEIAALRALGFSQKRMVSDVLWRSALLVGAGGLVALPLGLALSIWLDRLLQTMPGIPASLRFFVFEPRALLVYIALLAVTMAVAAVYPMWTVARLPISSTLRGEAIG
ncbi:MAG TPA: FtsX-like permease family protein [Vicinamibacterales bacterium]|nr:FtsX-like permease family protein [Vicinamibacterales bacterium]